MDFHAHHNHGLVLDTASLGWSPSPLAGVERRRLSLQRAGLHHLGKQRSPAADDWP
ncbi:MAG: hypothetical protein ACK6BC_13825 [Cyanobacteriota bacterium]